MGTVEIIKIVRQYLFDVEKKVWSESELEKMVEVAAEEYSSDTGEFRRSAEFTVDLEGRFKYPDDFIRYEVGWNTEDSNIEITCMHDLDRLIPGYNSLYGVSEFICDDLENRGYYNLYPVPLKTEDVDVYVFDSDYGFTVTDDYGIESYSGDYGTAVYIIDFNNIGNYLYVRRGSAEEIKDYMALVYHVCYQAYSTDSDFSDSEAAALYLLKYNKRIAMFNHVRHKLTGRQRSEAFY